MLKNRQHSDCFKTIYNKVFSSSRIQCNHERDEIDRTSLKELKTFDL